MVGWSGVWQEVVGWSGVWQEVVGWLEVGAGRLRKGWGGDEWERKGRDGIGDWCG